jgi:hypothetical protein
MNTIMEEKIKQAFQEWKQTDKPKENEMSRNRQLSNVLIDKIKDNPGITGKELRVYVTQGFPNTPISYVPALLKGFYDKNVVSREVVPASGGAKGRGTFAYTFVPPNERAKITKKAKAAKKVKAKPVHKEDKGITTLIPAERKPVRPLDIGPATLHITISTSQGAYSMKLEEAKFIYTQLNQIFGGAR